jgi:hypothetical protein
MSEVEPVGEAVKDEELFSRSGGMIMPHVVSPEVTGGEVTTPPILPKSQIDQLGRALAREERGANLDGAIDSDVEPS